MLTQSIQSFVAASSRPAAAIPMTPAKNAGTKYNVKEVEALTSVTMDGILAAHVLPAAKFPPSTPFQDAG